MPAIKYEVHVTTDNVTQVGDETATHLFTHVEIAPPAPKALAELVCSKMTDYIEGNVADGYQDPADSGTELKAIGFCDEGATVSTLIVFTNSRRFSGDENRIDGVIYSLQRTVELALSPSGKTIRTQP